MPLRADVLDYNLLFAGGRDFPAAVFGLPTEPNGPFPTLIYSSNVTSHMTMGVGDYTEEELVRAIRLGITNEDEGICPPMPSGVMAPFDGMSDQDVLDIAHYIQSLPPIENMVEDECALPVEN